MIGGTETELNRREQVRVRVQEFVADPTVNALCNEESPTRTRLAAGESALAVNARQMQSRAEELAFESAALGDEDGIHAALYLLDLCDDDAVERLSRAIETSHQSWVFGEYLLSRFPEARTDPEFFFEHRGGFGRREELYIIVLALIAGALAPPREPVEEMKYTPAASSERKVAVFPTVLVHGTYARSATWWREQPGQRNFWAYIHGYCPKLFGGGKEFTWSGGNSNTDREQGARDFINWWQGVGTPPELQVIAHSHGCNVVYLASVMEPRLHIANMVSLGGPVRTWYPPLISLNSRISRIHNIYSRHDVIQVLGSLGGRRGEGRTLADSIQITNHHIPWADPTARAVYVGHGDLHEPSVWNNNGLASMTLI